MSSPWAVPDAADEDAWVALDVDRARPNPARMYDYYLGGAHNFGSDRELAEQALAAMPWMREAVRANRRFLRRGVRHCLDAGLDQFLDLGAGIPTAGAVHEIVHRRRPAAEVVYVDDEPVAASHGRLLLESVPHARMVQTDLAAPDAVLAHPEIAPVIDPARPLALLALAVLHFRGSDEEVAAILAGYRAALAPGSLLVVSHVTADHDPGESAGAEAVYRRSANPVHPRSHERLRDLLAGFELEEPGLVDASAWRPDHDTPLGEHVGFYAAVARRV